MVGKYVDLTESYKSLNEALVHAGIKSGRQVNIHYLDSEALESEGVNGLLDMDAILVPGGFGERGVEGKIAAARLAREQGIPYLGICLGMQVAVIEFARNVAGLKDAHSTEFDRQTPYPVIALITEWMNADGSVEMRGDNSDLGGTMRLGAQQCKLAKGTISRKLYAKDVISERHRHRYEVNNEYREALADGVAGLTFDLAQTFAIPPDVFHAELSYRDRIQFDGLGAFNVVPRLYEAAIEDPDGTILARLVTQSGVVERDFAQKIDQWEVEIDRLATEFIAKHQPTATDLRFVIVAIKLGPELERIADNAVNIARYMLDLEDEDWVGPMLDLPRMLALAHHIEDLVERGVLLDYADAARRLGLARLAPRPDRNDASLRREFHGVAAQVADGLRQPVLVVGASEQPRLGLVGEEAHLDEHCGHGGPHEHPEGRLLDTAVLGVGPRGQARCRVAGLDVVRIQGQAGVVQKRCVMGCNPSGRRRYRR